MPEFHRGTGPVRVLLVEDDRDDFLIAEDLLEEMGGYSLDWAGTYAEGMAAIADGGYDAIVTDYRLGGRTGLEFVREAKAAGCTAPVILLTGQGDRELDMQAMEAGAADYLAKAELTAPLLERSLRYALERSRSAAALTRSRDFYMSIFDRFPALIWRSDATGAVDYFNTAWQEFTGRSSEQLLNCGWDTDVHADDRDAARRAYAAAFEACDPFEREYRLRHHSGDYRWVVDIGRPLEDLDGGFIGYIGGAFDVHDHRRTEQQLRESQRLEAVGRLAGGIAHDFNNVLSVVKGCASLALMDLARDNPLRHDLVEIDAAADRAANLTRQLLAFSRRQVLQPQVLNLNDSIREIEKMLRRTLGADIEFVTALDPGLGQIQADSSQIDQILMNLAVNARHAMPDGGKLITETRNVELSSGILGEHDFEVKPGRYALLSMSDTGAGMSPQVRERVFEPFFTTRLQGAGTGMGLSTVYGIVRQSGGYIWVYSEEGRGSTFKIYLPRVDAEVTPRRTDAPAPAPTRAATILLVEDEAAVRSTARRMLERMGHTVLEAGDGEAALRRASEHEGEIHLLLTDLVMPLMGGAELAERLTMERPELQVLFTSGYTGETAIRHGVMERGAAFLQKPYQPFELEEQLSKVLARRGVRT